MSRMAVCVLIIAAIATLMSMHAVTSVTVAASLQETIVGILEEKIEEKEPTQQDAYRTTIVAVLRRVADKSTTKPSLSVLLRDVADMLVWSPATESTAETAEDAHDENNESDESEKTETTPLSPEDLAIYQQHMVDALNQERQKDGKDPLVLDPVLSQLAQDYAQYLRDNNITMTHNPSAMSPSPFGGTGLRERVDMIGYPRSKIAENLAEGYTNISTVTQAWMASNKWHRENILGDFTHVGVAEVDTMWVHIFARQ